MVIIAIVDVSSWPNPSTQEDHPHINPVDSSTEAPIAQQALAWHRARATNGPAEAINNSVKRVKRTAFGLRSFRNYRVRSLLYAGRPNWDLLTTITPTPR